MTPAERLDARYQKFRAMGRLGQSFVDDARRCPARLRRAESRADAAARLGGRAGSTTRACRETAAASGRAAGHRAAAVPARPRRSRRARTRFLASRARSAARSVSADRHARGRRPPAGGDRATAKRIAIHGDYDVDGITSTVILRRAIELLGGDVAHFVPDRHQATATACSRRRSNGCTRTARG